MADDDNTKTVGTGTNGDRDQRGRFVVGNGAARGNGSARRQYALAEAVRQAITEDDLVRVVQQLRDLAIAGDTVAARLLLEHAVGRPREASAGGVDLPADLGSAQAIGLALATVAAAAAAGAIDSGDAVRIAGVLHQLLDARVVADLEARVADLEHN